MKTKYGSTYIKEGYHRISSKKEGNKGKYLHRVIFEDFYGEIPEGYVVHHKDGDKTNNCIMNLQLMKRSDHVSLHESGENHHFYGKNLTPDHRKKLSENHADTTGENNGMYGKKHPLSRLEVFSKSHNDSGIFRVSKKRCDSCKQGFTWQYRYYDENNCRKTVMSVDLSKLKEKVLAKGLKWIEFGVNENEVYN